MNSEPSSNPIAKRLPAIIMVVIVAVAAFVAYRFFTQKEVNPEAAGEAPSIAVAKVQMKTLFREDQVPGEIKAYQDVLIYPKVPGFVKWIGVDRGSTVKKGQLLVKMYAPEYISRRNEAAAKVSSAKAQLAASESKLESSRAKLKEAQAKLLSDDSTYQRVNAASMVPGVVATNEVVVLGQAVAADKGAVSSCVSNVQAADHEVVAAKENLAAAQKALDDFSDFASYLEISAPFDGYITDRDMHVGSFVGPLGNGAYPAICRIQQLDLLRVVAPIPERDTAGVLPGAPVDFTVSTFPGQRFSGSVARLGNYLDASTRTMPVELNYSNPDRKILPGMFCKIYWPTRRPTPTLFVPITAVVATPLDTFVCAVKDNVVSWVHVKKGQIMGDMVEIFGDIKEGDMVAATGSQELQVGTSVKPILASTEKNVPAPSGM